MTEILWNKYTAEKATFGQSRSFWEASGISFDTRKINKGDLFIALPGKRDGHDFVKTAFESGAVAAMVSKIPEKIDRDDNLLVVDDVMKALIRMAQASRKKSNAIFIGITGTSGKIRIHTRPCLFICLVKALLAASICLALTLSGSIALRA